MVVGSALAGRFRLCDTFVSAWWIRFHPTPLPPFGPLHSVPSIPSAHSFLLSEFTDAPHRRRWRQVFTKTKPLLLSPKQTNKKDVFAKRSLYTMHLMHPASSRYVGSEFFQALRFFFISTEVHNSCFVDLRCFFLLDVYHLCRGRLQMLLLWELLFTECSRAWRRDVVLALTAILLCRSAEGTCSSNWRKRKKSSRLALGYFGFLSRASLWLRLDDCSLEAIGEFLYSEHYAVKPKNVIYAEDIYLLYAFLYKDKHYVCL